VQFHVAAGEHGDRGNLREHGTRRRGQPPVAVDADQPDTWPGSLRWWLPQAATSASVTGRKKTPIETNATMLKQASSPVRVQARTPAPGRPDRDRRHSVAAVITLTASGTPATTSARHPLTPTSVSDL
jgi:hypothetical protein